jgi:hypothetical protein
VASPYHFSRQQLFELAERVGCGRGVSLEDLNLFKNQTCPQAKPRSADPVNCFKKTLIDPIAFRFVPSNHYSGRGTGTLVDPSYLQWMCTQGTMVLSDSAQRALGATARRARPMASVQAPALQGALQRAVEQLPEVFDEAAIQRAVIDPFGDHIVVGGQLGVAVFEPMHPERQVPTRDHMAQNPEKWALQSVRLIPIISQLGPRALAKLQSQPAGRAFLISQQHGQPSYRVPILTFDWTSEE